MLRRVSRAVAQRDDDGLARTPGENRVTKPDRTGVRFGRFLVDGSVEHGGARAGDDATDGVAWKARLDRALQRGNLASHVHQPPFGLEKPCDVLDAQPFSPGRAHALGLVDEGANEPWEQFSPPGGPLSLHPAASS